MAIFFLVDRKVRIVSEVEESEKNGEEKDHGLPGNQKIYYYARRYARTHGLDLYLFFTILSSMVLAHYIKSWHITSVCLPHLLSLLFPTSTSSFTEATSHVALL